MKSPSWRGTSCWNCRGLAEPARKSSVTSKTFFLRLLIASDTSAFPADIIHFRLAEVSFRMSGNSKGEPSAKSTFSEALKRLVSVPHSEIQKRIEQAPKE